MVYGSESTSRGRRKLSEKTTSTKRPEEGGGRREKGVRRKERGEGERRKGKWQGLLPEVISNTEGSWLSIP